MSPGPAEWRPGAAGTPGPSGRGGSAGRGGRVDTAAGSAGSAVLRALHVLRDHRGLDRVARFGLVGRGLFYLLLAVLVTALVFAGGGEWQANANGALSAVADTGAGELLLVAAAVGFAAFGLLRLVGAVTDSRHGRLRRLTTAGQGVLQLGFAAGITAFLLGMHGIGSEGEQRETAQTVLDLPGGRLILGGVGGIMLAVCLWQLVVVISGGFADSLHLQAADHEVRRLTMLTARIGIPARALAFAPLGGFLLVAAVRNQSAQAKGMDGFLLELTHSVWGRVVVLLVALGLVVFALYSFLEARFRQVSAGA